MSKFLNLALGILAAIGGFVDIGDLVFNTAAGATFGFQLMWVIPIGVVGIIVYSEMCGRVAAASDKAVFDAVRERVGFKAGLFALISSEVVNLLTTQEAHLLNSPPTRTWSINYTVWMTTATASLLIQHIKPAREIYWPYTAIRYACWHGRPQGDVHISPGGDT